MKIALFGSTGYVGKAVLVECLATASITSVVAITRKDPGIEHRKLTTVLLGAFSSYSNELKAKIKDAEACIYCLGTNIPVKPHELNRKINYEYAVSIASMFAEVAGQTQKASPFRFVYLSGALPEKDGNKRLLFFSENRKMRGELENTLLRIDAERPSQFRVIIARPGFVQPQAAVLRASAINLVANAILLDKIAYAMTHLAVEGSDQVLIENDQLRRLEEGESLAMG